MADTQGLPRVDELFEARSPKKQAMLAEVAGEIEIEKADGKLSLSKQEENFRRPTRSEIIHIHFSGMDEMKIKSKAEDEVLVKRWYRGARRSDFWCAVHREKKWWQNMPEI